MLSSTISTSSDRLAVAESRMYEAEIALHDARQTQVDEWINAAANRLHEAIADHDAAIHELTAA